MKNVTVDLENIGLFRKAESSDISEGNIVYLVGDGNVLHKKIVEKVLHPGDDWKAFCAEDGCRYGLYDLWVLISDTELQQKIDKMQNILLEIKMITNK